MKKRAVLMSVFLLSLIFIALLASAQEVEVTQEEDDQTKVDNAYACLEGRTTQRCSALASEERIFTFLATGDCRDEFLADSNNEMCWPKADCKIKATAQAILALKNSGQSADDAIEWLASQNTTPTSIDWFLQIESSEETTCTINYEGLSSPGSITIGADKKIQPIPGSLEACFSLPLGNWWLKVKPECYDIEFEISCDKAFLTTLLFQKINSNTIHVSEKVSSESAQGTTIEKIQSLCSSQGSECDYENSLWATLALHQAEHDIISYLPYLMTMADETVNEQYIPESFLYMLTGYNDFRTTLLLKQKAKYWDESGARFYDTAVALFPFQYEEPNEKTIAKEWLLSVQEESGCFGGIRDTAFVLYSVWPKLLASQGGEEESCESSGFFCMSQIDCIGDILIGSCPGISRCCSLAKPIEACGDQQGEVCNQNQICVSGVEVEASDLSSGEVCCSGGACEIPVEEPEDSECELAGGFCRATGCEDSEQEEFYSCAFSDACCTQETKETRSYWWIWLLLFLIILVVLGIIFKEKLRPIYLRIKSKFDGIFKKKSKGMRRGPPSRPGFPPARMPQRRMPPPRRPMPSSARPPARRGPGPKPSGEVNDVLKKLREMGK